jgi:hypothetical protein
MDEGSAGIAKDALHNYKLDGENKIKVCFHDYPLILTHAVFADYFCQKMIILVWAHDMEIVSIL